MIPVTEELPNWHLQTIARSEAKGKAEGRAEGKEETARNLFAMGMDDAFVSQATGLDSKTVKKMRASMCA